MVMIKKQRACRQGKDENEDLFLKDHFGGKEPLDSTLLQLQIALALKFSK